MNVIVTSKDAFPFTSKIPKGTIFKAKHEPTRYPFSYAIATEEFKAKGITDVLIDNYSYEYWYFAINEVQEVKVLPSILNKLEAIRGKFS